MTRALVLYASAQLVLLPVFLLYAWVVPCRVQQSWEKLSLVRTHS
jgi:hypothetical protein